MFPLFMRKSIVRRTSRNSNQSCYSTRDQWGSSWWQQKQDLSAHHIGRIRRLHHGQQQARTGTTNNDFVRLSAARRRDASFGNVSSFPRRSLTRHSTRAACAFSTDSTDWEVNEDKQEIKENEQLQANNITSVDGVKNDLDKSRKDRLLSLQQYLPKAMEEILRTIEEEQEAHYLEEDTHDTHKSMDNSEVEAHHENKETDRRLRLRFEEAWRKHCQENPRPQKQSTYSDANEGGAPEPPRSGFLESLGHFSPSSNLGEATTTTTSTTNFSVWDVDRDELNQQSSTEDSFSGQTSPVTNPFDVTKTQTDGHQETQDFFQKFDSAVFGTDPIEAHDNTSHAGYDGGSDDKLPIVDTDEDTYDIDELAKICVFLETMSPRDWKLIDADHDSSDPGMLQSAAEEDTGTGHLHDEEGDDARIDEDVQKMIDIATLHNNSGLTTEEYNMVLACVATSPDLFLESITENLLRIYHAMTKQAIPNETTYKILFLTLHQRIATGGNSSDGTIVTLVQDMMNFETKLSSELPILLGLLCSERENNLEVAKRLVMEYALDSKEHGVMVPKESTRILMKMFSRENEVEEAVLLLKKCMKKNGLRNNRDTDAVLDAAVRWPDRNRAGQQRDIAHVLLAFLEVIMDTKSRYQYEPGFSAWRNIIVALSRTAKADATRWELLRGPFHALFDRNTNFYPDEFLLRIGLKYCKATGDSKLARELVVRSVAHHVPSTSLPERTEITASSLWAVFDHDKRFGLSHDETAGPLQTASTDDDDIRSDNNDSENATILSSPCAPEPLHGVGADSSLWSSESASSDMMPGSVPVETTYGNIDAAHAGDGAGSSNLGNLSVHSSPPFSYKVFQKALKVCFAAGDVENGRSILDSFGKMHGVYPKSIESEIWGFALRGFSSLALDAIFVKEIFESMKSKGVKINDESCGAVIHSFAIGNQPEEAAKLFEGMKSGTLNEGIKPQLSCYNAMILAYVKAKSFDEVMDLYGEMKSAKITPDETTTQSVVIAAYRVGGKQQVRQILYEMLDNKVRISRENCNLALKILMPGIWRGNKTQSVKDLQNRLRDMGDEDELLRPAYLDLLRSFRRADIEQRREPTKHLTTEVLAKRRNEAWQATLEDILQADDKIRQCLKGEGTILIAAGRGQQLLSQRNGTTAASDTNGAPKRGQVSQRNGATAASDTIGAPVPATANLPEDKESRVHIHNGLSRPMDAFPAAEDSPHAKLPQEDADTSAREAV